MWQRQADRCLADYEVRSRHGWYRHVTLAMLALAFLAVMRVKLKAAATAVTANDKKRPPEPDLWSISAQMKSAISSAVCNSSPASRWDTSSPGHCGDVCIKPPPRSVTGNDAAMACHLIYKLNCSTRDVPDYHERQAARFRALALTTTTARVKMR